MAMPIFAFLLLGIMLFAFAAIAFFFFVFDHRDKLYTYDDDPLVNSNTFDCEFSRIGGSENEHTAIKISVKDGKARLFYSFRPTNGAPTEKKELDLPDDAADKLKAIYREHCVPVLVDCMNREEIALDAPSELIIYSAGENSYTLSKDQLLPEKDRGIFSETEQLMRSYII